MEWVAPFIDHGVCMRLSSLVTSFNGVAAPSRRMTFRFWDVELLHETSDYVALTLVSRSTGFLLFLLSFNVLMYCF